MAGSIPAQETSKRLYESVNEGCTATQNLITISWDMWHSLFPDQTISDLSTPVYNPFHNKIASAQRNTQSIQNIYTAPQQLLFGEEFSLCEENIMGVSVRFFFKSSHGVDLLFT